MTDGVKVLIVVVMAFLAVASSNCWRTDPNLRRRKLTDLQSYELP
jgi:hypothetical protein